MKGVTILIDEKKNNKIVQADIEYVVNKPVEFKSLIFSLIEEQKKDKAAKRRRNKY